MPSERERLIEAQEKVVTDLTSQWLDAVGQGVWAKPILWQLIKELRGLNQMRLKGLVYRRVEL